MGFSETCYLQGLCFVMYSLGQEHSSFQRDRNLEKGS